MPKRAPAFRRSPWAHIIGMRHRLVHAYSEIDPEVVWRTVTEFAPALLAEISKFLAPD